MSGSVVSRNALESAVTALEEYIVVYGNTHNNYFDTKDFDSKLQTLTIDFLASYAPSSKGKIEVNVLRLPDSFSATIIIKGKPEYLNLINNNIGLTTYQ
jgi:hypothetical protein